MSKPRKLMTHAARRLANDLSFAAWQAGYRGRERARVVQLLKSVSRQRALAIIELAIADNKRHIDMSERDAAACRAGHVWLEELRPLVFRGSLRVVR